MSDKVIIFRKGTNEHLNLEKVTSLDEIKEGRSYFLHSPKTIGPGEGYSIFHNVQHIAPDESWKNFLLFSNCDHEFGDLVKIDERLEIERKREYRYEKPKGHLIGLDWHLKPGRFFRII